MNNKETIKKILEEILKHDHLSFFNVHNGNMERVSHFLYRKKAAYTREHYYGCQGSAKYNEIKYPEKFIEANFKEIVSGSFADRKGETDLEFSFIPVKQIIDSSYRVVFLNTTIMTVPGNYSCEKITVAEAQDIIDGSGSSLSAIGHDAAARAMSNLLNRKIESNRIAYRQELGDIAIALKINGRVKEGSILTLEEMERIGCELFSIRRTS